MAAHGNQPDGQPHSRAHTPCSPVAPVHAAVAHPPSVSSLTQPSKAAPACLQTVSNYHGAVFLHSPLILSIVVAAAMLSAPTVEAKGAKVGAPAPTFRLPALKGSRVALEGLRRRPIVLIVGRSQKSAPACKKWMVPLVKRFAPGKSRVQVYQVVVIDKSWYVPRSLVLGKLRGFVGAGYRDRFLIEWYTVFADSYGIPRHDDPTVLLIDDRGVLRWRKRLRYSEARWQDLLERIRRLATRRPATSRGATGASRPASRPRPAH